VHTSNAGQTKSGASAPPHSSDPSVAYLNEHGADVVYIPHFLAPEAASFFYEQLLAQVEFDPPEKTAVRRPFSKEKVAIPRLQTAYGAPGTSYRFSGTTVHARPWIPILLELKEILGRQSGCTPNFVLLNYYRSGRDSIGWHSDDEKDLGTHPEIASLSFGATRDFQFRHKEDFGKKDRDRTLKTVTLALEHGSLLIMRHPTNRNWKHQLPKRTGKTTEPGARLNLTWRTMYR
jgi:alkylated DNA repair dioxygenase AlkB